MCHHNFYTEQETTAKPTNSYRKIYHALYSQISFLTCCHVMSAAADDAHHFSCIDTDRLDCVLGMFAMMNQNSAQSLLALSTMHVVYLKLVIFGDSIPGKKIGKIHSFVKWNFIVCQTICFRLFDDNVVVSVDLSGTELLPPLLLKLNVTLLAPLELRSLLLNWLTLRLCRIRQYDEFVAFNFDMNSGSVVQLLKSMAEQLSADERERK